MASSVPQAIPQLIAIMSAALPEGFQVSFDTRFNPFVAPQTLLITGIRFTKDEYAEMSPNYRHEEWYNVSCSLSGSAVGAEQTALLLQVYSLYSDISVAIANNPNLNNTVRLAWSRQNDFSPTGDSKGMNIGLLTFEVQIQARVDSLD